MKLLHFTTKLLQCSNMQDYFTTLQPPYIGVVVVVVAVEPEGSKTE